jgi:hypothetical protein
MLALQIYLSKPVFQGKGKGKIAVDFSPVLDYSNSGSPFLRYPVKA